MTQKMRPLWSREECTMCGQVGYATRTKTRPMSDVYVCSGCMQAQKHDAEIEALRAKLARITATAREVVEAERKHRHATSAWRAARANLSKSKAINALAAILDEST